MHGDLGTGGTPRRIVPSTTYRIRTVASQLPLVEIVIKDYFGQVRQPIMRILAEADGAALREETAEFPVAIPQAPNTEDFVAEISPYVDGIWLWEDLPRATNNLRCAEHLWRERPTYHRASLEAPM